MEHLTQKIPDTSKIKARAARLLLIFLIAGLLLAPAAPTQAQAAVWCQCVTYVKNRYGLSGSIGGSGCAADMGPYLANRGFVQVPGPRAGAVAVFSRGFNGQMNSSCGHVGVIQTVTDLGTSWQVTLRGANQGGSTFTEYNCTNVSNWTLRAYAKTQGGVTYWSRNFALGRPAYASSQQSPDFSPGKGNDGRSSTRWSSRISSSIGREWWKADMQAVRTFDRISVNFEAAYARNYFVGWSNDGVNFTGYWMTASSSGIKTVNVGTRSARWVAVILQGAAPGLGNYSFWEAGVFMGTQPGSNLSPQVGQDDLERAPGAVLIPGGALQSIKIEP